MDNVAARNWRQAQVTTHQMQVIAWQQNDFAGLDHEALFFTLNLDMKFAFDYVMKNNQMRRCREEGRAVLGRNARRYAPRREELGVQEHTAGQMRHLQDVG